MAIPSGTVWEVRTAGNDTNGGGFVDGASGTDYSQQNGKNTAGSDISTTDAVANGTAVITSITANFQPSIVGNIIYLQGGSGTLAAGWYQVQSRASATNITVDRTVAIGTGITMNIGGALASLGCAGLASGSSVSQIVWVKAGSYTVTSASNNVAGGCYTRNANVIGYQTTRGDYGTPPVIAADGVITTFTLIATAVNGGVFNITLDGNNRTGSKGISTAAGGITVYKVKAINCTNTGIDNGSGDSGCTFILCETTGCATAVAFILGLGSALGCVSHDNSITGFTSAGGAYYACISYNNSGATSDGYSSATSAEVGHFNSIAYNNGRYGFNLSVGSRCVNCISEANATAGYGSTASRSSILLVNCAGFNTVNISNISFTAAVDKNFNIGFVTGAGTFFTNAGSGDFSLNGSAGAALKYAGVPGIFPAGLTTGYLDIGAAQHQVTGGSSPISTISFG